MAEYSTATPGRKGPGGKPVLAYIKPSDYCNVGCDHCYLPEYVRAQKYRMDEETFSASLDAVEEMVKAQRAPGAMILWHGGEPLALPRDYFRDLCERTRLRMPTSIQAIQTSLIPYRPQWSSIVEEFFEGQIGSSVDFSQRTLRGSSEKYLELWMSKVEMARSHGHNVIPGMVPSRAEIGRGTQIADWLHDRGFRAWNIDRYNSFAKEDPARPNNREHSQFLTEAFDSVMSRFLQTGDAVRVNTVTAALSGILLNQPGDRWGGSCSNDFIVINPDGTTNACPDKISYEGFSNIKEGYKGFKLSEERKKWIREHLMGHRNSDCPTCPFNTFCKSGCPLTPNTPESEGECSGYHRHLRHVREWVRLNPSAADDYFYQATK